MDVAKLSENENEELAVEECVGLLMDHDNLHSQGFKFFMEHQLDLGINGTALQEVLGAIAKIGLQKMVPEKELPEEGCENFDSLKAAVDSENEQTRQKNEALAKLQAKIGFKFVDKLPEPEKIVNEEGEEV